MIRPGLRALRLPRPNRWGDVTGWPARVGFIGVHRQGYHMIRLTAEDILRHSERTIALIASALAGAQTADPPPGYPDAASSRRRA
jgi:hypothetical protein